MTKGAVISEDGLYRYSLTRQWDERPPVHWIMLNPSTADASVDDPTIRRCMGYARAWGYGGIEVLNLFALRATDDRELRRAADPVGPDNDAWLQRRIIIGHRATTTIAAWGTGGTLYDRDLAVNALFPPSVQHQILCLGVTKDGHPRHPLYLPADAARRPYTTRATV